MAGFFLEVINRGIILENLYYGTIVPAIPPAIIPMM